jgi:hypothetical protein
MPDDQDYADLADFVARPEQWNVADVERARTLRDRQAAAADEYDQRDVRRVASMRMVVTELDDALARWESAQ